MNHPVADEGVIGTLRVELRVGTVAVLRAIEGVRDTASNLHPEIVFTAYRGEKAGQMGMKGRSVGHYVSTGNGINLSRKTMQRATCPAGRVNSRGVSGRCPRF